LAAGEATEQILDAYPRLTRGAIQEALALHIAPSFELIHGP
jgi:uncharacterized protein (DUF433 family)